MHIFPNHYEAKSNAKLSRLKQIELRMTYCQMPGMDFESFLNVAMSSHRTSSEYLERPHKTPEPAWAQFSIWSHQPLPWDSITCCCWSLFCFWLSCFPSFPIIHWQHSGPERYEAIVIWCFIWWYKEIISLCNQWLYILYELHGKHRNSQVQTHSSDPFVSAGEKRAKCRHWPVRSSLH